jgi:hypothetical protein
MWSRQRGDGIVGMWKWNLQNQELKPQPPTLPDSRQSLSPSINDQRSTINDKRKKPLGVAEDPFPELPFFTK